MKKILALLLVCTSIITSTLPVFAEMPGSQETIVVMSGSELPEKKDHD